MLTDPPKKSPVLEAALIALFTAIATKSVDYFFAKLKERNKIEEEDEEEDEDTQEE